MANHYEILGLTPTASLNDIKKAYRKLSLRYHPDKTKEPSDHDKFLEISNAYEVLSNPTSKNDYDAKNFATSNRPYSSSRNPFADKFYSFASSTTSFSSGTHTTKTTTTTGSTWYGKRGGYYAFYQSMRNDDVHRAAEEERARAKMRQEQEILEQLFRKEQERKNAMRREQEELNRQRARIDEMRRKKYQEQMKKPESPNVFQMPEDIQEDEAPSDLPKEDSGSHNNSGSPPVSPKMTRHDSNIEDLSESPEVIAEKLSTPNREPTLDSPGNSSNPIVLDEEEQDNIQQTPKTAQNDPKSGNGNIDYSDETVQQRMNDLLNDRYVRPRTEPQWARRKSASPTRYSVHQHPQVRRDSLGSSNKKLKTESVFSFNDLNVDLNEAEREDNVDMSDIWQSLPGEAKRNNTSDLKSSAKRPKFEYTSPLTRGETLQTPVNKVTPRNYSLENFKSNYTVHYTAVKPSVPNAVIDASITSESWLQYVSEIEKYCVSSVEYKKSVLAYQQKRLEMDQKFGNEINKSLECFETYQKALQKDIRVAQEFAEQLVEFNSIMSVYKQNCNWVARKMNNGQ